MSSCCRLTVMCPMVVPIILHTVKAAMAWNVNKSSKFSTVAAAAVSSPGDRYTFQIVQNDAHGKRSSRFLFISFPQFLNSAFFPGVVVVCWVVKVLL